MMASQDHLLLNLDGPSDLLLVTDKQLAIGYIKEFY